MQKIKTFFQRYYNIISFALAFLGILGTIWGVYVSKYPPDQKPKMAFHINEAFNAVTLNKAIDSLEIYFKGKNLKKEKLSLTVYKIQLVNEGRGDLTENLYGDSLGLRIKNGVLIGINLLGDKKGYVAMHIKPHLKDSITVLFNKVIMESKKHVEFELLVIRKDEAIINFNSVGKISGMDDNIPVIQDSHDPSAFSFDDAVSLFLIITCLLAILFLGFGITRFYEMLKTKIRRARILRLFEYRLKNLSEAKLAMVFLFGKMGRKHLRETLKIFQDKELTQKSWLEEDSEEKMTTRINLLKKMKKVKMDGKEITYISNFLFSVQYLIKNDLATVSDGKLNIAQEFINEIDNTLNLI
jgi:hypothetical protein